MLLCHVALRAAPLALADLEIVGYARRAGANCKRHHIPCGFAAVFLLSWCISGGWSRQLQLPAVVCRVVLDTLRWYSSALKIEDNAHGVGAGAEQQHLVAVYPAGYNDTGRG